jgi:hypothetical protein
VVDLQISHNNGSSFASVFVDPSARPYLPAGNFAATGFFPAPITMLYQDQMRLVVTQMGAQPGQQILLTLVGFGLEN